MKATQQQKQALVQVMTRMCEEIHSVEAVYGIAASEKDLRPRIEYFHDVVRLYTQNTTHGYERTGRMTVESLAYDISLLREIQANPISRVAIPVNIAPMGSGKDVVAHGATQNKRLDGEARLKLMDLYKNYTVLFAAMLAEMADRNFQTRTGENNAQVEDIAQLEAEMKASMHKHGPETDIAHLLNHVSDPDLRAQLAQKLRGNSKAGAALKETKAMIQKLDEENKRIDMAHMSFLSSQLVVYEGAKDVVKKMANSGMNVVGDFMANAMREAANQGRGR
jgi:hypothetical protein